MKLWRRAAREGYECAAASRDGAAENAPVLDRAAGPAKDQGDAAQVVGTRDAGDLQRKRQGLPAAFGLSFEGKHGNPQQHAQGRVVVGDVGGERIFDDKPRDVLGGADRGELVLGELQQAGGTVERVAASQQLVVVVDFNEWRGPPTASVLNVAVAVRSATDADETDKLGRT